MAVVLSHSAFCLVDLSVIGPISVNLGTTRSHAGPG